MSTGDGPDGAGARDGGHRGERIGIGGGDDSVTRIQLAARWAEAYGPATDSLGGVLQRFRAAYDYLDSVTHGVEPNDLDREVMTPRPGAPQAGAAPPPPPPEGAPPPPVAEPRSWG
jgi:hypothetical protein